MKKLSRLERAAIRWVNVERLEPFFDDGSAPGHCHEIPGVWDKSNGLPSAGKPCLRCAAWNELAEAAKLQNRLKAKRSRA